MYKRSALLILAAGILANSAQAQIFGLTEAQKRVKVVPLIRALTDCVSKYIQSDTAAAEAYRSGSFSVYAPRQISECPTQVTNLMQIYDQVYGEGQALEFLKGGYALDIPRAVLARIKTQLEAKAALLNQQEADKEARDRQARADEATRQLQMLRERQEDARRADAERRTRTAEAEQRATAAKATAEQAQAEAAVVAAKAESDRLQRLEVAKRAESLIADKAADCARKQLKSLVRSGENAEVLASAVMTICGTEFTNMVQAGTANLKAENRLSDTALGDKLIDEKLRAQARDLIVALAVQAKAGVGAFAPASTSN